MDGVKIPWNRCPAGATPLHKCGKDAPVALNFNVVVKHTREVMHCTDAAAGCRNDKTMAHHDPFMTAMRTGKLLTADKLYNVSTFTYDLHTANGEGCTEVGVYLISDGGYHRWPINMFAPHHSSDRKVLQWAKKMESVRKDVECTFGIMKQRFRELKLPSEFKKSYTVSLVFKTCCHLHNRLLRFDELHTIGMRDSDWLEEEVDEREAAEERSKLSELIKRYAHVKPYADPSQDDANTEQVKAWGRRRDALIEHFGTLVRGERRWLATAQETRVRPHLQPGFTGDPSREEEEEMEGEEDEPEERESDDDGV